MNSSPLNVRFSRLAAAGLLLSACLLGGCGRKGPLDLPPAAANAPVSPAAAADENSAPGYRTQNSGSNAADPGLFGNSSSSGPMVAPRGEKKRIPIDAILD